MKCPQSRIISGFMGNYYNHYKRSCPIIALVLRIINIKTGEFPVTILYNNKLSYFYKIIAERIFSLLDSRISLAHLFVIIVNFPTALLNCFPIQYCVKQNCYFDCTVQQLKTKIEMIHLYLSLISTRRNFPYGQNFFFFFFFN